MLVPSRFLILLLLITACELANNKLTLGQMDDPEEIVQKVEAYTDTTEVKPGQLITVKISVQLKAGWHTYPTQQEEKGANSFVNKISFPKSLDIIAVDKLMEPANAKFKAEPAIRVKKMAYYPGGGVWEQKVIISPKATVGEKTIKVNMTLSVCDKDNCLPPKKIPLEAKIKVQSGSPLPIDAKYQDTVKKALGH